MKTNRALTDSRRQASSSPDSLIDDLPAERSPAPINPGLVRSATPRPVARPEPRRAPFAQFVSESRSSVQHLQVRLPTTGAHCQYLRLAPSVSPRQTVDFTQKALGLGADLHIKERSNVERQLVLELASRAQEIDQHFGACITFSQTDCQIRDNSFRQL